MNSVETVAKPHTLMDAVKELLFEAEYYRLLGVGIGARAELLAKKGWKVTPPPETEEETHEI